MEERTGEAFELGERLTILGKKQQSGEKALNFELDYFDTIQGAIRHIRLEDTAGSVRLLNVINSLDTPVCHIETRHWEQLRKDLPAEICLYTVSMDLPFAQARWNSAEGVTHQTLSAHRNEQFGTDYGVLIKEWRLLQRAVFVIDRHGRFIYIQYVADQMREPDYEPALAAARQAALEA